MNRIRENQNIKEQKMKWCPANKYLNRKINARKDKEMSKEVVKVSKSNKTVVRFMHIGYGEWTVV